MPALGKSEKERFEEHLWWRKEKEAEFERVVKWIYQEFCLLKEFGCAEDIRRGIVEMKALFTAVSFKYFHKGFLKIDEGCQKDK